MVPFTSAFERLYIHVPFCHGKCGYCAFYSEPKAALRNQFAYTRKIIAELRKFRPGHQRWRSIYVGGGTPTVLNDEFFSMLMTVLGQLPRNDDFEFTVEANPESLSAEKVHIMAENGVTRVSLGAQTFRPELRRILQRAGDPGTILPAIDCLQKGGIARINADLIYAIPTQTLSQFKEDLDCLLNSGITHLSAYSLTPDEGARLCADFAAHHNEALSAEIWEKLPAMLMPYGLRRYEISNYAVPGEESRHNLGIWQGDPYLGLGPAAAGYNGVTRFVYPPSLDQWLAGAEAQLDVINPEQRAAEVFAFGLRTVFGWSAEKCLKATGRTPDFYRPKLAEFETENMVIFGTDNSVRLTERGLEFWDTIAGELL